MSRPRFNPSRRRFATQVAQTAGSLALALGTGRQARAAQDKVQGSAEDPRFLINIHTQGGADTFWFQNYCKPEAHLEALRQQGKPFDPTSPDSYDPRFDPARAIAHGGHFLGLGMSVFSKASLSKMLIWKGLRPNGDHMIGNRIINCGLFSNYAASYSSLISAALAQRSLPLPLQYVQASTSAEALYTWPGLLTGYALAVNLPSQAEFAALTSAPAGAAAGRRGFVNAGIDAIGQATARSGFRLKSSAAFYESFMASFRTLNDLRGKGSGGSIEFLQLMNTYYRTAIDKVNEMRRVYGATEAKLSIGFDEIKEGNATLAAAAVAITEANKLPAHLALGPSTELAFNRRLKRAAYAFALGEYLVTHGLSRVVDIGPVEFSMDAHSNNGEEVVSNTIKYAMLDLLIQRLGDVSLTGKVPGTQDHDYLKHTTIAMTTEFDRTPNIYRLVTTNTPGTNHGQTASVILAGRGVAGGRVVGDIKDAPDGYGRYGEYLARLKSDEGSTGMGAPLPIDLATGLPSLSGQIVGTSSIFPTILSLFDVIVPAQQTTEGVEVPAVKG